MTGSRIRKLKALCLELHLPISKVGFRRLKAAYQANPELDVAVWFADQQHKDARRIWERMSPEEQGEVRRRHEAVEAAKAMGVES